MINKIDIKELFINTVDCQEINLDDTELEQIETWDSMAALRLLMALEKHFKIKLAIRDFLSCRKFSEIQQLCLTQEVK